MKTLNRLFAMSLILVFSAAAFAQDPEAASDDSWPRQFKSGEKTFTVYQPQVESWKDNKLEERVALSVQNPGSSAPTFGVAWISARTETDKPNRLVGLEDIKVTKISFPTETGSEPAYKTVMADNAKDVLGTISMDRLRASMAINANEAHRKVDVKNDPPEIIYSEKPAVLAMVDGAGVLRETGTPGLLRVINTSALIVFNKEKAVYDMNVADKWYQSTSLDGEWKPAGKIEQKTLDGLNAIKTEAGKDTENFTNTPDIGAVYSSTKPADLVQTKGAPNFEPIKGTEVLYVTNSPDNIFLYTATQDYYITLSGRWFKSRSIKGPWKFIDADKLPKDFANIPEGHPKGEVLASVAGTPDAQEAEIANEIPQTATVDRKTATLSVEYDGAPKFVAINGSSLYYASNTRTPVIQVNGQYYAVENGVWFKADAPAGPWVVTSEVPQVIYTIPPSAPVYYVTYAYVYGSDPDYVYVGYLPGYLGSYVAPSGVVVYGTGYYYRPWVSHVWIGCPYTYGFGFAWGMGFGWTFRSAFYGAPVYHPWWGPWHHYGYERPWGERHVTVNHINVYNSWNRSVIRQSSIHPFHPVMHVPSAIRNRPVETVNGRGMGTTHMPVTHPTNMHNNVYADHAGNVYRHDPNQGWQHYQGTNKWEPVKSSPVNVSHEPVHIPQQLDREKFARERGAQNVQRFGVPRMGNGGGHVSMPRSVHVPSVGSSGHRSAGGSISHSHR